MEFSGKTVLITGAAVGIGRACALQFANSGANVVLVDLNKEMLAETENEIKNITDNCLAITCDVSNNDHVISAVEKANNRFGRIDILVNSAALWRGHSLFSDTDLDVWRKFIDVNILGTVYFTKALAKEVTDKGITVNAVSPGSVSPADNRDIDFSKPSDLSFMGRTGTGRENADLICFLASEKAGYISGQNIQIDGCRKKQ